MVARALVVVALFCCACAHDPIFDTAPLVPDLPPAPSATAPPAPLVRSFETKTIGSDRYPAVRPTTTRGSTDSSRSTPARSDPSSPTPDYGNKNPSPPAESTPVFGDLNPSPPSRGTPRYGDLNPSPPSRGTPRYGDPNPSPPSR